MLTRPALLLFAIAFVIAGCSNPFPQWTRGEVFAAGWLTEQVGDQREPALYCYGTIAEPDCYGAPLTSEGDRLIGHSGPDTADTL